MYLEQYLALARSQTSEKTLGTCIEQALGHPQVFVFGELLAMPSIQKLQTSSKKHFDTLQLFAYKGWGDYAKNQASFIPLNDKMKNKLRLLTLCQLAMQQSTLSYEQIAQNCGLPNDLDQIESIVLSTVQSQLLECRIDQRRRLVHILSVSATASTGRDAPQ